MKKVVRLNENDIENLVKKIMNESSRSRKIGSYRARNGKVYPKFIDDENYVFIKVGPHESDLVTIEGDGEVKTSEEVQKEIDEIINYSGRQNGIKENERPRGGMTFGPFRDIVDAVTDRYRLYRDEYKIALDEFNENWPLNPNKIRTIQPGE